MAPGSTPALGLHQFGQTSPWGSPNAVKLPVAAGLLPGPQAEARVIHIHFLILPVLLAPEKRVFKDT